MQGAKSIPGWFRSIPLRAIAVAWCAGAVTCAARGQDAGAPTNRRLVHVFDFDERDEGNLESVPKFWEPLRTGGFPGFADGSFDHQVGHLAPPSFYLQSRGRNVAYQYGGPALKVRTAGNYRVNAFLRPVSLSEGRTCLCAFFRDRHGKALLDTFVRTSYLSSADSDGTWIPVELFLQVAPPDARTIGLAVWVLQRSTWDTSTPIAREIQHVDVNGGVWIDDISVTTLPMVLLTTSTPGNVLEPADDPELIITTSDHEVGSMDGSLTIRDATSAVVLTREIPITLDGSDRRTAISVAELPVGWYHARLTVSADGAKIVDRSLSFARVAASVSDAKRGTTSFGISITPGQRSQPLTELALLRRQFSGSVKIPVWSAHHDMSPGSPYAREHDVLLQELLRRGFALTAVLAEIPMSLAATHGAYGQTAIGLLGDSPGLWQDELAAVAAPYASTYRSWQVGADADSIGTKGDDYSRAVRQVRDTLGPYIPLPRMTAGVSHTMDPLAVKLPVEQVTLLLGASGASDHIARGTEALGSAGYEHVSVLIEPHDAATFDRIGRLANWAQRLIVARHGGANVVYTPPTWRVRDTVFGAVTEPREEFILLRTLADVIRSGRPGPKVPLAGGAQCFAFNSGSDESLLALWDPAAPPGGREHTIQLGAATQVIDLWGRKQSLTRDQKGRHQIRLTSTPVLVPGVERWLVEFRSSFSIVPDRVMPGQELVRHRIESTYFGATPVTGRATLLAPEQWRVEPREFAVGYSSGEPNESVQTIYYSHRESAGAKEIPLQIRLNNENYWMEIPLRVTVAHDDLHVQAAAVMEGDTLVVRHFVSNQGGESTYLRGSIAVPGRMRQYRPFSVIRPGETRHVEYRLRDAGSLIGRRILLGLREMRDNPRVHNLELTVP